MAATIVEYAQFVEVQQRRLRVQAELTRQQADAAETDASPKRPLSPTGMTRVPNSNRRLRQLHTQPHLPETKNSDDSTTDTVRLPTV
jgi:hypothetical protein